MVRKRIYLHIGTHKTGTTSIQFFCDDNRARLEELGYLYPKTGCKWKGHHELAWALGVYHPDKRNDISNEELWRMLVEEISLSGASNVIISSEDFEWVTDAQQLRQYLAEFDVKVIIYLRRQDNYIQSFYSTHVRDYDPRISKDIDEYVRTFNLKTFNCYDYIKTWEDAFCRESILVRVFEEQQMPDGLIADFLRTVGIFSTTGFMVTNSHKTSNKSLHPECLEFLRLCNRVDMTKEKHSNLCTIVESVSDMLYETGKWSEQHLISPLSRLEIVNRYNEQNEKTARYYLHREDGRLFYDEMPNAAEEWSKNTVVSIETLIMLFAAMWGAGSN